MDAFVEGVKGDLNPNKEAAYYVQQLAGGGYYSINAVKQAASSEKLAGDCGLQPGEAVVLWNAAGGHSGTNNRGAEASTSVPITSPSETNDLRRLGALVPFLQAMVIQGNYQGTSSTASTNKSQRQQQDFKLNLYNYYFRTNVQSLPDRFRCMISGLKLEHPQIIAAHLWPKSKAVEAAAVFNIPDVWNVRNGLLWANPFEKAWHQYEIAILRNPVDGELFLRVLTDDLMKTKLMDYQMGEGGCSFGFKCFRDFDGKEIQQVCEAAMPYKRALLHQAVSAIMYQRGRGELRKEVTLRVDDYEVASDFEKRPDVQRWVDSLLV